MDQDLNPKLKPEENIAVILRDRDTGKVFLNMTLFAPNVKPTVHKWGFIKLKGSYKVKKQSTAEEEAHKGETIFASYTSDRFIPTIYKVL